VYGGLLLPYGSASLEGAESEVKDSDGSSGRVASSRTMLGGDVLVGGVVRIEDGSRDSMCKHHGVLSSSCVIRRSMAA
jgi:uncharacterized heparinase superfamily protein